MQKSGKTPKRCVEGEATKGDGSQRAEAAEAERPEAAEAERPETGEAERPEETE